MFNTITREEAVKKYIPVHQAKPHEPLKGDFFIDFTKDLPIKKSRSPKKIPSDPINTAMQYRDGD